MKHCKMGSYEHSVAIQTPEGKLVNIDRCVLPEIETLWSMGIKTHGCCCGHGMIPAMVNVDPSSMVKMVELGYIGGFNRHGAPTFALMTQPGTASLKEDEDGKK